MTPAPPGQAGQWSFGLAFQQALLRLMVADEGFCALCSKHLDPSYFETPALTWIFVTIRDYLAKYGRPPSSLPLIEGVRSLDAHSQGSHAAAVEAVLSQPAAEADFIQGKVVEFIKRNLIVGGVEKLRALYNAGQFDDVCAFFQQRNDELQAVMTGQVDRSFFFEEFDARQKRRADERSSTQSRTVPTGVPDLDKILQGGLSLGELGIWVARAKIGKSSVLRWHSYYAVRVLRIPVLHIVLEGGREQTEDFLESAFAMETRAALRSGMDHTKLRVMRDEYQELKKLLVIRGYTKDSGAWNVNIQDVYAELSDLRQRFGFRPRLIVIDYGDLLKGRHRYDSPTQEQAAAFRDIKTLTDRDQGYAIWTASQAQRPKAGQLDNPKDLVRSSHIADAYEKVRCADFIGTINRSTEEQAQCKMRLYAELYRSAAANKLIEVSTDFEHGRAISRVLSSSVPADE